MLENLSQCNEQFRNSATGEKFPGNDAFELPHEYLLEDSFQSQNRSISRILVSW